MCYKQLNIHEREIIVVRLAEGKNYVQIAKELKRHHSSISAEVRRNSVDGSYAPNVAQQFAEQRRCNSKTSWKMENSDINQFVKNGLKQRWSPEQISGRMAKNFPKNHVMRISHETIYQWIRNDKNRGGQWKIFLRQSEKKRRKRYGTGENRGKIKGRIDIDERPSIVDLKQRLGDWEGDTVEGRKGSGYLTTMVDRKSKYLVLDFSKTKESKKIRRTIVRSFRRHGDLPCETTTLDNGKEFADHVALGKSLDADIFFAKPYRSWERGLNENTNGLLRQHFPKGSDFRKIRREHLRNVEAKLNNRPRKTLDYRTPNEVMYEDPPCGLQS